MSVLNISRLGRIEPKGGTRASYEKRPPAGSKAAPCCVQCKAPLDLTEMSMVNQMDALDGIGLCADCVEANFLKENRT